MLYGRSVREFLLVLFLGIFESLFGVLILDILQLRFISTSTSTIIFRFVITHVLINYIVKIPRLPYVTTTFKNRHVNYPYPYPQTKTHTHTHASCLCENHQIRAKTAKTPTALSLFPCNEVRVATTLSCGFLGEASRRSLLSF